MQSHGGASSLSEYICISDYLQKRKGMRHKEGQTFLKKFLKKFELCRNLKKIWVIHKLGPKAMNYLCVKEFEGLMISTSAR